MAKLTVNTPVDGFTGTVAGVDFSKGKAEVEDGSPAMAYFRRHGYKVADAKSDEKPDEKSDDESADAKSDEKPSPTRSTKSR